MRFLVRLRNDRGFTPMDSESLTMDAYRIVQSTGADIGNLRVSSSAVELDLLTSSKEIMERALTRLEQNLGQSVTVRELDTPTPVPDPTVAIRIGISLFNEERYWESHESLEIAWRTATGREREILQGVILLAASLVHLQKNDDDIALSILKRASAKIPERGELFGIDLTELKRLVRKIVAVNHPTFFRIPSVDRANQ